jgi:hypothetical protein
MNRLFSLSLLIAMTTASAQGSLTFVCGAQADWCQAVANAYKKETGGEAKFLRLSAGASRWHVCGRKKPTPASTCWSAALVTFTRQG